MGKTENTEQQEMDLVIAEAVAEALKKEREEQEARTKEAVEKALEEERALKEAEIAEAVAKATKCSKTVGKVSVEKNALEELVKVKIAKDKEHTSDVVVSVNGRTFQIKRGEEVEVPSYVREVLENTVKMDELSLERMQEANKNF